MSQTFLKRMSAGTAIAFALGLAGSSAALAAPPTGEEPAIPPCASGDLAVSLDTPKESAQAKGQFRVAVTFKNISDRTCVTEGVPTVDLVGPEDPNGPVYTLVHGAQEAPASFLTPDETATTTEIVVLTPSPGAVGSTGSTSWTPTHAHITPKGLEQPMIAEWDSKLPVLRQDGATHPGSFVEGIPS
ncbi:DUF4232 domain-containing protein [Allokutzneria sp. NRRL B-24872]|uniref:DUF4232 domain-containing protein n=1 Tax=Allokutzneria sp. NRRL B-24872 TaxID=1137961 RepID=UPI001FEF00A1|nr:DUF4232 domain-containing protein [Allokutzneria sp. NRRL B-24872]